MKFPGIKKSFFIFLICILSFTFGFLLSTRYQNTSQVLSGILSDDVRQSTVLSIPTTSDLKVPFFDGYNGTHLWLWKLADQNHFKIANEIPCRTIEYTGGPPPNKIDSCDKTNGNEFSLANLLEGQKWIYEHQHPVDCSNKRFAIIHQTASSGFGSTLHQIAWAFAIALLEDRIAVYKSPGNWLYGDCDSVNPDCVFLPISNCSVPSNVDGQKVIYVKSDFGHWAKPIHPPIFQNRTFNWYRSQLVFYLMRFKSSTLAEVQKIAGQNFNPPSVDQHRPYIAVYVRRSDKVQSREMSQAYTLKQYFDLFDNDTRRAKIDTVYLNSEDEQVFNEINEINKEKQGYYKLITINTTKNVLYGNLTQMSRAQRGKIVLEFLTDLYIEANADLHAGTLTSNWCRLVDEIRLILGKIIPFYTPENKYLLNW